MIATVWTPIDSCMIIRFVSCFSTEIADSLLSVNYVGMGDGRTDNCCNLGFPGSVCCWELWRERSFLHIFWFNFLTCRGGRTFLSF